MSDPIHNAMDIWVDQGKEAVSLHFIRVAWKNFCKTVLVPYAQAELGFTPYLPEHYERVREHYRKERDKRRELQ